MKLSLLGRLRCPFCGGELSPATTERPANELEYTVLSCYCGQYPVVAGIPILKKGTIRPRGPTIDRVIALVEAGRHREALITMLMPPPPAIDAPLPLWLQGFSAVRGVGRLKRLAGGPVQRAWRKRAGKFLTHLDDHVTAWDLFDFHFCHLTGDAREPYPFYAYRFGQPRHLVALSFVSLISQPDKPILDLGCGFGHITRSLPQRAHHQPVIGVDINFFSLYVAKGWMAPEAEYVCCAGDTSVPFPDGAFSTVLCCDAFWVMHEKMACIRELKRLTRDAGLILVVGVRNKPVKQHLYGDDCWSLPPAGYEALVADMPHRLIAHRDVLGRYVQKLGPPLARSAMIEQLVDEQWLSLVASHRTEVFRDHGPFEDWPHAEGCLTVNPLYREDGVDGLGNVRLRLAMPSPKYEQENADCRKYAPETALISPQALADLGLGRRTPELERLIEQCVVLGMPERFLALRAPALRS